DTEAFFAYLDTRHDVAGDKVGTVGFCMGGGMAITAAGVYPGRVAAAASFHGSRLATDDPASPHLLARKIRAELYIAVADNDRSCPPEMVERFTQALDDDRFSGLRRSGGGTRLVRNVRAVRPRAEIGGTRFARPLSCEGPAERLITS